MFYFMSKIMNNILLYNFAANFDMNYYDYFEMNKLNLDLNVSDRYNTCVLSFVDK